MNNNSSLSRDEMAKALAADAKVLLEVIGDFSFREEHQRLGVSGGEPSQEERLRKGEHWLNTNQQKLKEAVCNNANLQGAISKVGADDNVSLGLLLADACASVTIGVPPVFIAALVVKIGFQKFCRDTEGNS